MSVNTEYYRARTTAAHRAKTWARGQGLKAAGGLLAEIVGRSHPKEPWSWVRLGSMDDMAAQLGLSKRTLHRQLTDLTEAGVLQSEVREVASMRKPGQYPVYTIAPDIVLLLLPDKELTPPEAESAKMARLECQNGTLANFPLLAQNPQETSVSGSPSSSCDDIDSKRGIVTSRRRRRLRPRLSEGTKLVPSTNPVVCDIVPEPVIVQGEAMPAPRATRGTFGTEGGQSIPDESHDNPTKKKRVKTPAAQVADHFEVEWVKVRNQYPERWLPFSPWSGGHKSVFYAWVNKNLIPAAGSLDAAKELVTLYCTSVINGSIQIPGERTQVFRYMSTSLDQLRATHQQTTGHEEAMQQFQEEAATYRANRAKEREANRLRIEAERKAVGE